MARHLLNYKTLSDFRNGNGIQLYTLQMQVQENGGEWSVETNLYIDGETNTLEKAKRTVCFTDGTCRKEEDMFPADELPFENVIPGEGNIFVSKPTEIDYSGDEEPTFRVDNLGTFIPQGTPQVFESAATVGGDPLQMRMEYYTYPVTLHNALTTIVFSGDTYTYYGIGGEEDHWVYVWKSGDKKIYTGMRYPYIGGEMGTASATYLITTGDSQDIETTLIVPTNFTVTIPENDTEVTYDELLYFFLSSQGSHPIFADLHEAFLHALFNGQFLPSAFGAKIGAFNNEMGQEYVMNTIPGVALVKENGSVHYNMPKSKAITVKYYAPGESIGDDPFEVVEYYDLDVSFDELMEPVFEYNNGRDVLSVRFYDSQTDDASPFARGASCSNLNIDDITENEATGKTNPYSFKNERFDKSALGKTIFVSMSEMFC